jgi:hypothetical protein
VASLDHVAVTRVEHQVGTLAVERPELPTQAHDPDRVVCARSGPSVAAPGVWAC